MKPFFILRVAALSLLAAPAAWAQSSGGCLVPPSIVSTLPVDSPISDQVDFNCFAWQEFIALTWKAGTAGQPDPTATAARYGTPGDPAPTVWETYASDTALFRLDAETPAPWGTGDDLPPVCAGVPGVARLRASGAHIHVMGMISKFDGASANALASIGQAFTSGAWLTGQNQKLTYYEVRVNEDEFDYVVQNGLYNALNQGKALEAKGAGINLPSGRSSYGPVGAIETKAAWIEITDQSLWPTYRMVDAAILDYEQNPVACRVAHMGLVGLHIIHKTPKAQQFVWATFEHVRNAPDPTAAPSGAYTYFNGACDPATDHYQCRQDVVPVPCDPAEPSKACDPFTAPVQTFRTHAIPTGVVQLNFYTRKAIAVANPPSVYANYQLINVLWPSAQSIIPPLAMAPLTDGAARPLNTDSDGGVLNATMETYFQGASPPKPQLECLDCHSAAQAARQQGGTRPACAVATIIGQKTPGPCAADYSFIIGHASCPKGVACAMPPTIGETRLRMLTRHP